MKLPKELTIVTKLSKYLAMLLFILLPFSGFILGMQYYQSKNNNTFQKILADKCKLIRFDNVSEQISQNDLPFNIDNNVIKINYKRDIENPINYPIVCIKRNDGRTIIINNTMGQNIVAYDHRSSDKVFHPGEQGQDLVLFDYDEHNGGSGNTKMGIILELSGSDNYLVGEQSVIVVGQKWLELPNGNAYYINIQKKAIAADDPRLVAILKKYSFNSSKFPGKLEINNWGAAQKEIRYSLFVDLNNRISNPEKDIVLSVRDSLNAFTAK